MYNYFLFSDSYYVEQNTSHLCDSEINSKYNSLVGSENWIITSRRFCIANAVYIAPSRDSNFEAMEHVFRYLDKFPDRKLVIGPT